MSRLAGRRRRIVVLVGALLTCAIVAACGGTTLAASGPAAAGKSFVDAITVGDTHSWCPQIGRGMLGLHGQGKLPSLLLKQCEQSDLFLITGSCFREAAVAGTSVASATTNGDHADVALSNGARLELQSARGRWFVEQIVAGHSHHTPSGGPCSNNATTSA